MDLPGLDLYDPSLPWAYKVREDGSIATDTFWYIDDGRTIATTAWKAWKRLGKYDVLFVISVCRTRVERGQRSAERQGNGRVPTYLSRDFRR